MYSWDLQGTFEQVVYDYDLKRGFELVQIAYYKFPKEVDSICVIILQALLDTSNNIKQKLLINTLIDYYNYLLSAR